MRNFLLPLPIIESKSDHECRLVERKDWKRWSLCTSNSILETKKKSLQLERKGKQVLTKKKTDQYKFPTFYLAFEYVNA